MFVLFAGVESRIGHLLFTSVFASSVVLLLILIRMLEYPFEGALALGNSNFVKTIERITRLTDASWATEFYRTDGPRYDLTVIVVRHSSRLLRQPSRSNGQFRLSTDAAALGNPQIGLLVSAPGALFIHIRGTGVAMPLSNTQQSAASGRPSNLASSASNSVWRLLSVFWNILFSTLRAVS